MNQRQKDSNGPGNHHQHDADSPDHDGRVSEGLADGYMVIIGHHHQEKTFCDSKCQKEKALCHAASKGDRLVRTQEVSQHPGHGVAGIGCVNDGQVWEEEVLQSGVQWDEPQDDPVPQQGEGVRQAEEPKEKYLNPWAKTKSQENEFCNHCLISPISLWKG